MTENLKEFLGADLLALMNDGEKLKASVSGAMPAGRQAFNDYSFVVFPFAKAYEGFLKKLFLKIGAINEFQFKNDRWRVGRALNPQLEKDLRHEESVYDRIANFCGPASAESSGEAKGANLPEILWEAWKRGRNEIFHYYPDKYRPVNFEEAKQDVAIIMQAMEKALEGCKITT